MNINTYYNQIDKIMDEEIIKTQIKIRFRELYKLGYQPNDAVTDMISQLTRLAKEAIMDINK